MKTTLQLTFNGWDAELLDKATAYSGKPLPGEEITNEMRRRRYFIQWAVMAVARAVIAAKKFPCPMAVQLRLELREETSARVALLHAHDESVHESNEDQILVLCEALESRAKELGAIVQNRVETKLGFVPVGNRWN